MEDLKELIQDIVKEARALKDEHTTEKEAPVNYACIFSQSQSEYDELLKLAEEIGRVVDRTKTGILFQIEPMQTVSGLLQLLKIRIADHVHPERGDADFTVSDYAAFRNAHLSQNGFRLIVRPHYEMIELMDSAFNVRAYFSNPPIDQELGLSIPKTGI